MSSTDTPPAKRRRETSTTESLAHNQDPVVKSSSRFWFADGNVVLQAQSTQFRVHRSVLSLHSEVMKDCFDCPQPDGDRTVEGCPVVHLTDSSMDIDILCGLLYGVYYVDGELIEFDYLAAMIRMGRKYEIPRFKSKALHHLRQLFPRDLQQWLANLEPSSKLSQTVTTQIGFLHRVINLAHENDIPSILPAAFISLCLNHTLITIVAGLTDQLQQPILQPLAMQRCILGRAAFPASLFQSLRKSLICSSANEPVIPSARCRGRIACQKAFVFILGEIIQGAGTGNQLDEFPVFFSQLCEVEQDDVKYEVDFCPYCHSTLEDTFKAEQQKWWQRLPGNFSLPSWEMIKDFDM